MIVMPPIGTHFAHPSTVRAGVAAERFLDRRIDENAFNPRIKGRRLDDRQLTGRPDRRIDIAAVGRHHIDRGHLLALDPLEFAVRHRRQPNIGIEADLMAGVTGDYRPAARLRHVADQ